MSPWSIDIRAQNRAAALEQIKAASLPLLAARHLSGIVAGEDYVHGGERNPDRPFHLAARGYDHEKYIGIDHAVLEYES